jgi:hypothetical protein
VRLSAAGSSPRSWQAKRTTSGTTSCGQMRLSQTGSCLRCSRRLTRAKRRVAEMRLSLDTLLVGERSVIARSGGAAPDSATICLLIRRRPPAEPFARSDPSARRPAVLRRTLPAPFILSDDSLALGEAIIGPGYNALALQPESGELSCTAPQKHLQRMPSSASATLLQAIRSSRRVGHSRSRVSRKGITMV